MSGWKCLVRCVSADLIEGFPCWISQGSVGIRIIFLKGEKSVKEDDMRGAGEKATQRGFI